MKIFLSEYKSFLDRLQSNIKDFDILVENAELESIEQVKRFIKGLRFLVKKRNTHLSTLLDRVNIKILKPNNSLGIGTMAVDGKGNLFINMNFVRGIMSGAISGTRYDNYEYLPDDSYNQIPSEGEKIVLGIIAHELQHIFKDHVPRMKRGKFYKMIQLSSGNKISLWNIVTDIEINYELLYKYGYHLIRDGIIPTPDGTFTFNDKEYNIKGKTPERMYREFLTDLQEQDTEESDDIGDNNNDDSINIGDVVFDKQSRKYGIVTDIDENTGNVEIEEITKEEAKNRLQL